MGRYAKAEETLRAAKATAERLGLPGTAALAAHNLGRVLARRGALVEARTVEQSAVDAYRSLGIRRVWPASTREDRRPFSAFNASRMRPTCASRWLIIP